MNDLPRLETDVPLMAMMNPVDPRAAYADVHARCPVARTETGVAVFSMDQLLEINRHPDILGAGGTSAPQGTLGAERPLIPLDIDGDIHKAFRHALDPIFAPRKVAALEDVVRRRANELIDAFINRGSAELYGEFCSPLPSSIFIDMMGLPLDDVDEFIRFKDDVVRPQGETMDEILAFAREAGKRAYAYFNAFLDDRAASGKDYDDWTAYLVNLEVEGEQLTRTQVLDIMYLLVIAGLDTVVASLSCILAWLAQHPTERAWLFADGDRWPLAIEELMRYESPVMYGTRLAAAEVKIGGREYPAGTVFNISWAGANTDPLSFPEPDRVILDRTPNRHAGFATGRHRCLGSHLARMELRVAMEEFHKRIPEYRIDPDGELIYTSYAVRAASQLPITF